MSGILTEIQAKQLLGPHHSVLYTCVANAFARWLEGGMSLVARPDASFRSHLVQQFMVDEARQRFGDVPGVTIFERKNDAGEPNAGRFLLGFGDDAIVQFKKLDPDFRTRNFMTPSAVRFDSQEALPNVPIGTRLSVGYQLSVSGLDLAAVAVVCQGRHAPCWWYELEDALGRGAILPPAQPLRPAQVRVKEQLNLTFDEGKESG